MFGSAFQPYLSIFAPQSFLMKTKYFFLALAIFCSSALFAQTKTDSVKVWGECDECKGKIENAAMKGGAVSADWNMDTYVLVVSYDNSKTSAMNIEKEIVPGPLHSCLSTNKTR